jgi:hypothetical protein
MPGYDPRHPPIVVPGESGPSTQQVYPDPLQAVERNVIVSLRH